MRKRHGDDDDTRVDHELPLSVDPGEDIARRVPYWRDLEDWDPNIHQLRDLLERLRRGREKSAEDSFEAAREEFMAWVAQQQETLDRFQTSAETIEEHLHGQNIAWASLLDVQRISMRTEQQCAEMATMLGRWVDVLGFVPDVQQAVEDLRRRAMAMGARYGEINHDVTRFLGEAGRAHSRTRLATKKGFGAHDVYR
jgi:hypothetical protein